ncbi:MAG: RNA-binding cell elongation regulator Jag/EloR [Actinomycetota bacterium]|nr:RNA-binding cell elongation regulator Jag/EloR [Actinomycetota bacterium]
MDWVEVQGKTVEVAVGVAIKELGLHSEDDVKIEVIQEPKAGFLGVGGKDAIVKVTKAPARRRRRRGRSGSRSSNNAQKNRQNTDKGKNSQGKEPRKRRQEKQVSQSDAEKEKPATSERPDPAPIEEQARVAASFVSGLLDAFGLEGSVDTRIEDDVLYIEVTGSETEALVGPKGSVMQSVYELTRTVVQRKTYGAPRMRIDIAGYRERRRAALTIYAGKLASQVIDEDSEVMLEPMNAADRKVVHDAVAEIAEVRSYSEGEDPRRAVVIAPAQND